MKQYKKCWRKVGLLGHRLGTRPHQIHRPFESPHDLMDLSITGFGVLATGEHVQCWTIVRVVTEQNLFPRDELEKKIIVSGLCGEGGWRDEPLVQDIRGCGYTDQTLSSISG